MSSIKRDVKRKVSPRPEAEKIFVSRSSPLPVSVPLDSLERFVVACLPFPWLSSSGVTIFSPEELIMRLVKIVF
jgi:hypothetical protein